MAVFPELVSDLKMLKARRAVSEGVMLERLSTQCEVLSPSSSPLKLSRRQGAGSDVCY